MKYQSVVRVTNISTIEFRSEHVLLIAESTLALLYAFISLSEHIQPNPLFPGQPLSESLVFYLQDV